MNTIEFGMAGYFKFEAFKSDADGNEIPGSRRVLQDWAPNLITNGGLDMLGVSTGANWMNGCHVGSGTTAPANGNTALETFVAGVATTVLDTRGVSGTDPYYGYQRRTYRFAAGTFDSVNLTEVGISSGTAGASGSARLISAPLFSRSLINGGTGITVLVDESLDVTYEIRRYAPAVDVTGTLSISAVSYNFTVRACNASTLLWWAHSNGPYGMTESTGTSSAQGYSGTLGAVTGQPATEISLASTDITVWADYTAGNYYRDVTFGWGLAQGDGSFRSFRLPMKGGAFQLELDPPMVKDASKVIDITLRVSWARA